MPRVKSAVSLGPGHSMGSAAAEMGSAVAHTADADQSSLAQALAMEELHQTLHPSPPYSSTSTSTPLPLPLSLPLRIQQTLASCSQANEAGDFSQSEASISELVDFLNSVSDSVALEPENEECHKVAVDVLSEIHKCITAPSLDQAVIDALSFELPKAVARFSCVSNNCLGIAESIVNRFIETCSPRDMASVLCEALDSPSDMFKAPGYFIPLLSGIAKVFVSIERKPFEHVKAAVPLILKVLEDMSSEPDIDETGSKDLYDNTIPIVNSVQAICEKMEAKDVKRLSALLGLFVLQIVALASITMGRNISRCFPVVQLSRILGFCGLSSLGLITGCEVDNITEIISADTGGDYISCFSYVKHGAALAVIWSHMPNEAADATMVDSTALIDELRSNQIIRWKAVGMLKHIFACANLPWELKREAVNFLLFIMEGKLIHKEHDADSKYSVFMPSLYSSLQAVQIVIIYASDAELRKKAFVAFKKVLSDVPTSLRLDIIIALIKNSESSMIAILLGFLKDEMLNEIRSKASISNGVIQAEKDTLQNASFWGAEALDLVEWVLKPPRGGPPSLPEDSDAVLSALNLYRFVLLSESSGKTNYTGVRSKDKLQKAYSEWLEPLCTLVSGIAAENQMENDQQLAFDIQCALNPLQLVLYRCIELVEENLKHSV